MKTYLKQAISKLRNTFKTIQAVKDHSFKSKLKVEWNTRSVFKVIVKETVSKTHSSNTVLMCKGGFYHTLSRSSKANTQSARLPSVSSSSYSWSCSWWCVSEQTCPGWMSAAAAGWRQDGDHNQTGPLIHLHTANTRFTEWCNTDMQTCADTSFPPVFKWHRHGVYEAQIWHLYELCMKYVWIVFLISQSIRKHWCECPRA